MTSKIEHIMKLMHWNGFSYSQNEDGKTGTITIGKDTLEVLVSDYEKAYCINEICDAPIETVLVIKKILI